MTPRLISSEKVILGRSARGTFAELLCAELERIGDSYGCSLTLFAVCPAADAILSGDLFGGEPAAEGQAQAQDPLASGWMDDIGTSGDWGRRALSAHARLPSLRACLPLLCSAD